MDLAIATALHVALYLAMRVLQVWRHVLAFGVRDRWVVVQAMSAYAGAHAVVSGSCVDRTPTIDALILCATLVPSANVVLALAHR